MADAIQLPVVLPDPQRDAARRLRQYLVRYDREFLSKMTRQELALFTRQAFSFELYAYKLYERIEHLTADQVETHLPHLVMFYYERGFGKNNEALLDDEVKALLNQARTAFTVPAHSTAIPGVLTPARFCMILAREMLTLDLMDESKWHLLEADARPMEYYQLGKFIASPYLYALFDFTRVHHNQVYKLLCLANFGFKLKYYKLTNPAQQVDDMKQYRFHLMSETYGLMYENEKLDMLGNFGLMRQSKSGHWFWQKRAIVYLARNAYEASRTVDPGAMPTGILRVIDDYDQYQDINLESCRSIDVPETFSLCPYLGGRVWFNEMARHYLVKRFDDWYSHTHPHVNNPRPGFPFMPPGGPGTGGPGFPHKPNDDPKGPGFTLPGNLETELSSDVITAAAPEVATAAGPSGVTITQLPLSPTPMDISSTDVAGEYTTPAATSPSESSLVEPTQKSSSPPRSGIVIRKRINTLRSSDSLHLMTICDDSNPELKWGTFSGQDLERQMCRTLAAMTVNEITRETLGQILTGIKTVSAKMEEILNDVNVPRVEKTPLLSTYTNMATFNEFITRVCNNEYPEELFRENCEPLTINFDMTAQSLYGELPAKRGKVE